MWEAFAAEYLPAGPVALQAPPHLLGGGRQGRADRGGPRGRRRRARSRAWATGRSRRSATRSARSAIDVRVLDYTEHALSAGSDAQAAAYVECEVGEHIAVGHRRRHQHRDRLAAGGAVGGQPGPERLAPGPARPGGTVAGVRENDGMGLYRDDGIVLRTQKLGEADRIVTVLARHTGRVRAVGKGVRRTKSRFGARLEPFTHVDLQLYDGRLAGLHHPGRDAPGLRRAAVRRLPPLHQRHGDAGDRRAASPPRRQPALRQFLLLVGGLRALGEGAHDPRLVLDAFLLRSLAVAGYAPALEECAVLRGSPDVAGAAGGLTRVRARGGRPDLPVLPAGRCGDAVRADGRADERAAAGRLGARRRVAAAAPGRVQRPGRRVPAVAPGAFHPLASACGACVRLGEEPA